MIEICSQDEATARSVFEAAVSKLCPERLECFQQLVEELKPDVNKIQEMPATTKYRYGRWMMFLSDQPAWFVVSCALVTAGADARGVLWALKCLGHI